MATTIELTEFEIGLIKMIEEIVKTKCPGDLCSVRDLLDEDFFDNTEGEHVHIGRRISFLVSIGRLPLEPCGFNKSRHNQYRVLSRNTASEREFMLIS